MKTETENPTLADLVLMLRGLNVAETFYAVGRDPDDPDDDVVFQGDADVWPAWEELARVYDEVRDVLAHFEPWLWHIFRDDKLVLASRERRTDTPWATCSDCGYPVVAGDERCRGCGDEIG